MSLGIWNTLRVLTFIATFEMNKIYVIELIVKFLSRSHQYKGVKIHDDIIVLVGKVKDAEGS